MKASNVIEAYVALRDRVAAIDAEAKKKTGAIKEQMTKLEAWIIEETKRTGATSIKTPAGTAFITTAHSASVADWSAVLDWIKANDAYDMLNKAVNKTAVRGYIDANNAVPPGVNYSTRLEVNVRRPSATAE